MCPKKIEYNVFKAVSATPYSSVRQFRPAVFKELKSGWIIEYYAFNPAVGKLCRKRANINKISGKSARRTYALSLVSNINEKLYSGWNPFISDSNSSNLTLFCDAVRRYREYADKMYQCGYFREQTYRTYISALNVFVTWMNGREARIVYTYQLSHDLCVAFLDHIFIDCNNLAMTYNKYLSWLRVFCGFLQEKGMLKELPTDGIKNISRRLCQKSRTVIPQDAVKRIAGYLRDNDPYFLLSCYLLYYCHIRPVEQTRLKISDIRLADGLIDMRGEISKNRKSESVTLHPAVARYMLDLGIFSHPGSCYVLGERKLHPGSRPTTTRVLRSRWASMAKRLKFKKEWKFYSLKDTGITEMLSCNVSTISVRDQARHSSLAITDMYTPHRDKANKEIQDFNGSL